MRPSWELPGGGAALVGFKIARLISINGSLAGQ
jgi:hypothetical protein